MHHNSLTLSPMIKVVLKTVCHGGTRVLQVWWNSGVDCVHIMPLDCWDLHSSCRIKPHDTRWSRYPSVLWRWRRATRTWHSAAL